MVANKRANPLWGGFLVTDGPVLCLYDQYTHPFNFIIRDPDKKGILFFLVWITNSTDLNANYIY